MADNANWNIAHRNVILSINIDRIYTLQNQILSLLIWIQILLQLLCQNIYENKNIIILKIS